MYEYLKYNSKQNVRNKFILQDLSEKYFKLRKMSFQQFALKYSKFDLPNIQFNYYHIILRYIIIFYKHVLKLKMLIEIKKSITFQLQYVFLTLSFSYYTKHSNSFVFLRYHFQSRLFPPKWLFPARPQCGLPHRPAVPVPPLWSSVPVPEDGRLEEGQSGRAHHEEDQCQPGWFSHR